MLPIILLGSVAVFFLAIERIVPGRNLPRSDGWYIRALAINLAQLGVVVLAGFTWEQWMQGASLFRVDGAIPVPLQGFLAWFVGTFIFYWWHRARHQIQPLWIVFHQIHHSAARIETVTSFYKHPVEITFNSMLSSAIIFVLLGASVEAAPWYSFFAAFGEFFYHANIRTPHWTGWFLQRPELHSIHHQRGVHHFNYGDITWWDRVFGTFRDTGEFASDCGFRDERETKLGEMLMFRDVNPRMRRVDRNETVSGAAQVGD